MKTNQLNMEQRKILKNLFQLKLNEKRNEIKNSFNEETKELRKTLNEKINKESDLKEIKLLVKKTKKLKDNLFKKGLVILTGEYGTSIQGYDEKTIRMSYHKEPKEIEELGAKQMKKLKEIEILEQEMIADIYSLSLEYNEMVKFLNTKLNSILK